MAALASNMIHHHHFSRRNLDSTDGSVSMDSSDNFDIESPNIDNISCTSDDTVLSVGNENPDPPQSSSDGGTLSFKNIESHLNAISQITNSTLNPESSPIQHRLSPSSSTKSYTDSPNFLYRNIDSNSSEVLAPSLCSPRSTSDSDSPRSPGRQQENLYYNQNRNSDKNNDANQGSLKFSIDNILKADFGRRITDPINIRKSKPKRVLPKNEATKSSGPVDLSKNDTTPADNASKESTSGKPPILWPAWVYCTRYSDRPSSGPRTRRVKKPGSSKQGAPSAEEKRPRTAFSGAQLARLKHEFAENRYLTERRRQQLSAELGLNEAQIKIWFQNKRAKIKKASGQKNPLALQLMAQGLYNHSTIPLSKEEEELEKMQGTSGAS